MEDDGGKRGVGGFGIHVVRTVVRTVVLLVIHIQGVYEILLVVVTRQGQEDAVSQSYIRCYCGDHGKKEVPKLRPKRRISQLPTALSYRYSYYEYYVVYRSAHSTATYSDYQSATVVRVHTTT